MVKKYFAIAILLLLTSCQQQGYIKINIEGWGNDTVYVAYAAWSQNVEIEDTLVAKNGHIQYDIPVNDTINIMFTAKKSMYKRLDGLVIPINGQSIITVMTPFSKQSIMGELKGDTLRYDAVGSKFHKDNSVIRNKMIPFLVEIDRQNIIIEESLNGSLTDEQRNEAFNKRTAQQNEIAKIKFDYIKNNLDSDLSAKYLTSQPSDVFVEYLAKLSPEVRNGMFKHLLDVQVNEIDEINKILEARNSIVVGNEAPDFRLMSLDGSYKNLSEFKGKWVIIDFWGSWCGWCIKGFPHLKEIYKKYNDKLEIIGIACGDNEDGWRKAVAENRLTWVQLINNDTLEGSVSVRYGVDAYPTKLLINPEQKIAIIAQGDDGVFYEKLEKLLQ